MKPPLTIVKVGGGIIEDPNALDHFIHGFISLQGKKILVHGGGKSASKLATKLGLEVKMKEGRRITDDPMMEVVIMTYGGLINKKIVAQLNAQDASAIGLTGADASCIIARKRPIKDGIDFGWVGDIEAVDGSFFSRLLGHDHVPVVAPLSLSREGHLLNTNADTMASQIAISMSAYFSVTLDFVFEQKGVLTDVKDPDSLIHTLDKTQYMQLKQKGMITDGMIPKLDNAFDTLASGVKSIRILNTDAMTRLKERNFDGYTRII